MVRPRAEGALYLMVMVAPDRLTSAVRGGLGTLAVASGGGAAWANAICAGAMVATARMRQQPNTFFNGLRMEHLSGEKCSKAGLCELSRSEQLAALEMQLRLLKVKKKQPEGEGYIFFAASPSGYVTYGRFFGARMARFAVDLRHFCARFAANDANPLWCAGQPEKSPRMLDFNLYSVCASSG